MALGAIAAIRAAGKVPGKDITVVSIDGSRDALTAVDAGDLYASVESNPRFGPKAFETMKQYAEGQVPVKLVLEDRLFNKSNAAQNIDERLLTRLDADRGGAPWPRSHCCGAAA